MTGSEKLLDAIGQIDDKLIEEAAAAGGNPGEAIAASGACAGAAPQRNAAEKAASRRDAAGKAKSRKGAAAGRKRTRAVRLSRWQSALAACAVLAVCTGAFLLLQNKGLLLAPKSGDSMEAAQDACSPEDAAGAKAGMEEAVLEEGAADAAAPEKPAAETGGTGSAGGASAEKIRQRDGQPGGAGQDAAAAGEDVDAAEEAYAGAAADGGEGAATGDPKRAGADGGESQTIGRPAMQESIRDAEKENEARSAQQEDLGSGPAAGESGETRQKAQSAERPPAPRGVYLGDWNIYAETNDAASDHVTFTVRNEEEQAVLSFGGQYTLEVRNGDRWETLETKEDPAAWKEMLITVEPGGEREETVEFQQRYGSLAPGFYRLVRPCRVEQDGEAAEETLYVEFGL